MLDNLSSADLDWRNATFKFAHVRERCHMVGKSSEIELKSFMSGKVPSPGTTIISVCSSSSLFVFYPLGNMPLEHVLNIQFMET